MNKLESKPEKDKEPINPDEFLDNLWKIYDDSKENLDLASFFFRLPYFSKIYNDLCGDNPELFNQFLNSELSEDERKKIDDLIKNWLENHNQKLKNKNQGLDKAA